MSKTTPGVPSNFTGMARRRYSGVPKRYRKLYLKVVNGAGTRSEAIKAMCLECMGYDVREITQCSSVACPLNRYRPFRRRAAKPTGCPESTTLAA